MPENAQVVEVLPAWMVLGKRRAIISNKRRKLERLEREAGLLRSEIEALEALDQQAS